MKNQFMPLFWGDFLADTMDLSAQEVGAYFLLIAHAWGHDGLVPCDTAQRIARVNNFHWERIRKRLEPFFEVRNDPCCSAVDVVHRMYYHDKVHRVLTSTAEISNKRKEAAMQMHSKSKANGHANDPHLYYTNKKIESSLGKEEENGSARSLATALPSGALACEPDSKPPSPKPVAEKQPSLYRKPTDEEANDYRSPPKTKPDNILEPIPERPAFKRP